MFYFVHLTFFCVVCPSAVDIFLLYKPATCATTTTAQLLGIKREFFHWYLLEPPAEDERRAGFDQELDPAIKCGRNIID